MNDQYPFPILFMFSVCIVLAAITGLLLVSDVSVKFLLLVVGLAVSGVSIIEIISKARNA